MAINRAPIFEPLQTVIENLEATIKAQGLRSQVLTPWPHLGYIRRVEVQAPYATVGSKVLPTFHLEVLPNLTLFVTASGPQAHLPWVLEAMEAARTTLDQLVAL